MSFPAPNREISVSKKTVPRVDMEDQVRKMGSSHEAYLPQIPRFLLAQPQTSDSSWKHKTPLCADWDLGVPSGMSPAGTFQIPLVAPVPLHSLNTEVCLGDGVMNS